MVYVDYHERHVIENQPDTTMKSQFIRIRSTPVIRQPLPFKFESPRLPRLRRFRVPHPLEGLENAPGTLPPSLVTALAKP